MSNLNKRAAQRSIQPRQPTRKEMAQTIAAQEREIGAKQAKIDELMLEYCPGEMSREQFDEWARHQRPGVSSMPDSKLGLNRP